MLCNQCKHFEIMFNKSHCNHPNNLYKRPRVYHPGQIRNYTIEYRETSEVKNKNGDCKDFEHIDQMGLFKNYEVVPEIGGDK